MSEVATFADYHTAAELQQLGEQIRDKAIEVTIRVESAQASQLIRLQHDGEDPLVARDHPITPQYLNTWAHGTYDAVPSMFTSFATPNPRNTQPTIDSLWGVAYALKPDILGSVLHSELNNPIPAAAWKPDNDVATRITDITNTRLDYWHGQASDSFQFGFLSKLTKAVPQQCELAVALAVALTAQQQLTLAKHKDVWEVGHKTLTALDGLHDPCQGHDINVVLTVVTAAISVILAVPTRGLSLAGLLGLTKASQGLATTVNTNWKIGGETVYSVINSMADTLAGVLTGQDEQEQVIQQYLDKIGTEISPQDITPPEPKPLTNLANASRSILDTQFYPVP
jgi:hypothetical protein